MDGSFAGRYVLEDVLGAGGSGIVHRAHDTVLDRTVAIKLLRAGAEDDVLRARLRAEAQLAGQLHHPGIAQVFDYGELDSDSEPAPYIVMQYVEGVSLWQMLRESRTLPVTEVMDLVAQVADALQAAHAAGIVHRDLKPSNVLVTPDGRSVLVDFGIARTSDAEPLTNTGTIVGTADYVSPEQCAGRPATARSDLYSLGMLAYECLTGHKPFHRESAVATALAHLSDEVPPLVGVPSGVADLVMQLVRKEPEDRPATAGDVAARAFALAGGRPLDDTRPILPPPPPPSAVEAVRVPLWRQPALRSRRFQVSAAAVAVFLAVTGFVSAGSATPTVPDVEGMTWAEARSELTGADLEFSRTPVDRPGAAKGTVLDQSPAPGSEVDDDTVVVLEVASGQVVLDPDDVVGLSYRKAASVLVGLGLVPARNDVERPGGDGTVVTSLPAGRMPAGTMVTLNVGVEPSVVVPDPGPAPVTSSKPGKPAKAKGRDKGPGKGHHKGPGKGHGKAKGHGKGKH